MPPPDVPRPRELENPVMVPSKEHESGAANYESAEEPEKKVLIPEGKEIGDPLLFRQRQKLRWVQSSQIYSHMAQTRICGYGRMGTGIERSDSIYSWDGAACAYETTNLEYE